MLKMLNILVYPVYSRIICLHLCAGLSPGDFIHVIGDAHVYRTHVRALEEQIQKLPKPFPVSRFEQIYFIQTHKICRQKKKSNSCDAVYLLCGFWFSYIVIFYGPRVQILKINPLKKDIDSFVASDFKLDGYDPHKKIEMEMAI
jgi:dihydrofolate reductase/thymidylate synthase